MKPRFVKNSSDFKRRLRRFFHNGSGSQYEARVLLDELSSVADIYIFGGLVRDLAIYGNKGVVSDIDVVYEGRQEDVLSILKKYKNSQNKFGGWRLLAGEWEVDIWKASDSWVVKEGYSEYNTIRSLLGTTITNWEGALYCWNENKIICHDNYFEDLSSKYLDVNKRENPNVIAMYVKIFRYFVTTGSLDVSSSTARLLKDSFESTSFQQIKEYEIESYGENTITHDYYKYICVFINNHQLDLLPSKIEEHYSIKDMFVEDE